ncbi:GntR family transcriptional regulator [Amaricoccus sp. W119]|uniref:GntR family transcriptional regulator n=1 Tax=Amaricoccus sp. W119 TaxID=3391833 RepID=UPI0039A500B3
MHTRYAQVARDLTEAISSGRYPVGSLLPTEMELAEQFSVSRSTIRAAMQELRNTGLVSRRKSVGTRVESAVPPREQPGFFQAVGGIEEVQQFGEATIRQTMEIRDEVADDAMARLLGVRPGSRWLRISSLRLWRDRPADPPVCWTDVYIEASFAAGVRDRFEQATGLLSELIEDLSGRRIQEIRQRIQAVSLPPARAATLRAEAGGPALELRRQYYLGAGSLAEVSVSLHPGDRFSYSTVLNRRN